MSTVSCCAAGSWLTLVAQVTAGDYTASWVQGAAGDSNDAGAEDAAGGYTGIYITVVETNSATVSTPCPVTNVHGRVRTRQTAFGVDDFSDWVYSATIASNC